ncbi:MAG: heavy metal sensor histidine kinase [Stagnimonas sp.]|nr:heavy metal sensor histidine kinase [Stagnimonas sp.]
MKHAEPTPYSLGQRLSWLFATQTLVGLGAVCACIYTVMAFNLAGKADSELSRKSELIRHLVSEAAQSGDLPAMRHKLDEFFMGHEDLQVTLLDRSGNVTYESPGSGRPAPLLRYATFDLPRSTALPNLAQARIIMDRSGDAQLLAGLAFALLVATILGAAVVSAAGFWVVRRSLAPLRGLALQTRSLRADQLGQRLSLERPVRELQPWIDQFNELLGRLHTSYRQLEGFNADVAHELRTPLATLIGQSEVELTRDRSTAELRETLGSNLEELRRLSSIVNDMLFLSRADRGARAAPGAAASLAQEVAQVLEFYDPILVEKNLTTRLDGDARISFDKGLIRRAVSNLLSNAIRYADPGSEIQAEICQSPASASASVVVKNAGIPISEVALPRLFDRFFRIQTSREGGDENHGLGLAIVAAIARMHGGHTLARSEHGITSIGFTLSTTTLASEPKNNEDE